MPTYTFRRDLKRSDWLKAMTIGAGAGVGTALAVAYLAGVFMRRTPLREPPRSTAIVVRVPERT